MHYNSQMGGQYLKQVRDQIFAPLQNEQSECGPYDFVTISGDVPEFGLEREENLKQGFEFLCELREIIGSPPLLICIGNQDAKRPEVDENFLKKIATGVFDDFIAELNSIRTTLKNDVIHPIFPDASPSKREVTDALDALITANFDRNKLEERQINLLPFFWLRGEKKVFCYLLSTANFSAISYAKKGTNASKVHEALKEIADPEMRKQLGKAVLMRDVPYVEGTKFNVLKWIADYFKENDDTRNDFLSSIKIAVFHHPLILLPDEVEIREFDGVANGSVVAAKLSKLGFSIFLYGHKHTPRISVNFGNWTLSSKAAIVEFLGICGDRLFGKPGNEPPIFPILEIENVDGDRLFEKNVSVKMVSEKQPLSDAQRLMSFDRAGNLKWIYCDNKGLVVRQQTINEKIWNLVKQVENCFLSTTEYDWSTVYGEPEQFLFEFIEFLEGYCKGLYGMDPEFIQQLKKDLAEADALYFIDILESPAWAHPIFMYHLALQIRAYLTRNRNLLDVERWSHSTYVEQALQRLRYRPGQKSDRLAEEGVLQPTNMDLDICRILIWDQKKVNTIFGRTLIVLHNVFKIPLFYLDPEYYKKNYPSCHDDFHLVVKGEVVTGYRYDANKKKREVIKPIQTWVASYEGLLKDEKLLLASHVAGLEGWK